MKIIINEREDYSWCELPEGGQIYGRSVSDVSSALDALFSKNSGKQLETEIGEELPKISYNR